MSAFGRLSKIEMALEKRGNNSYYYKKERRGDKVVSVYVGHGDYALLSERFQEICNAEREHKRLAFEAEKEQIEEIDQMLDQVCETGSIVLEGLYLTHGYHKTTKRQWRRKRV